MIEHVSGCQDSFSLCVTLRTIEAHVRPIDQFFFFVFFFFFFFLFFFFFFFFFFLLLLFFFLFVCFSFQYSNIATFAVVIAKTCLGFVRYSVAMAN